MAKRDVALIIHDGVQALDVAGPMDVFAEANAFLPADEGYQCSLIARSNGVVHASNGMLLQAHLSFDEAAWRFQTVLVAGGPGLPSAPADPAVSTWLQTWAVKAERYGSICTGAFTLGHAGLLDGHVVTTHWQNVSALAERFPATRVEHDRIFSRDGALVTSAGVTAGIDLALALVSEDHGSAIALACAKRLVVVVQRQGGQSQFSPLLVPFSEPHDPLVRVQAYIAEHLRESFSAERLAELAGSSTRSVARLFSSSMGVTPRDFVESVRVDHARNLLEATDLALKAIAFDCGFANPERMRDAFRRRLGITPVRYRESFRSAR